MIIKFCLVYSPMIGDFFRDGLSFSAGMPTSDESYRRLNAPELPRYPTMESAAATPAKRKNLVTRNGKSPGKLRDFTATQKSKKLRYPGGRSQIVDPIPAKKGKTWRALVTEEADDNKWKGILKKCQRADSAFASKQARGLKK